MVHIILTHTVFFKTVKPNDKRNKAKPEKGEYVWNCYNPFFYFPVATSDIYIRPYTILFKLIIYCKMQLNFNSTSTIVEKAVSNIKISIPLFIRQKIILYAGQL